MNSDPTTPRGCVNANAARQDRRLRDGAPPPADELSAVADIKAGQADIAAGRSMPFAEFDRRMRERIAHDKRVEAQNRAAGSL